MSAAIFNSIPLTAPKRNAFQMNHQVKLTCEMGNLVPIFCEPTIPGDRFKVSTEQLVRFAPLQSPIMSDVDVYVHFFFVPNRLLWNNWETFITGSKNGKKLDEADVPSPPFSLIMPNAAITPIDPNEGDGAGSMAHVTSDLKNGTKGILSNGNLADYLGFQTYTATPAVTSSTEPYPLDELPFRAYQRVWFDYYRDENLSDVEDFDNMFVEHDGYRPITNPTIASQSASLFSLRQRAWRKDYFTSALPFAQAGDDVLIPGVSSFESSFSGNISRVDSSRGDFSTFSSVDAPTASSIINGNGNTGVKGTTNLSFISGDNRYSLGLNLSNLKVVGDVSGAASEGTIRELRRAFAAQAFLERRAVGGTRYNEQILAFFGVRTSDGRLQRAQWLGGSKQPVVVSQVLQTSQTTTSGDDASPLGQPGGVAVSAGGRYIFDREFEEYGFVMGILSVMPKATYMQGIPRKYMKHDVYDYYWPQFARIGEQEIKNSELYFGWNSNADGTFGYTPRYAEYRFVNSRVHGDFKDTLDFWHLGRDFNATPGLNEAFITCRPSTRVFAYENSDFNHLWIDCHVNFTAIRPIPKYAEASPI